MNISTINTGWAQTALTQRTTEVRRLTEQMATGLKVNRASDNPAALIASMSFDQALATLQAQSQGYELASNQAATADAGLAQAAGLLTEANRLAVANGNLSGLSREERAANQMQLDAVLNSLNRVGSTTQFQGMPLLNGTFTFGSGDQSVTLPSVSTSALGQTEVDGLEYTLADVSSGGAITTLDDPEAAQKSIASALSTVVSAQGQLGAYQQYTIQAGLSMVNTQYNQSQEAVSNLRDLNYATASAQVTRAQLLSTAGFRMMMESMGFTHRTAGLLYSYLSSLTV